MGEGFGERGLDDLGDGSQISVQLGRLPGGAADKQAVIADRGIGPDCARAELQVQPQLGDDLLR
jgi:hypothetical protein